MVFPADGGPGSRGTVDTITTWDTSGEDEEEEFEVPNKLETGQASEQALNTIQEQKKTQQLNLQHAKIDGFQNVLDIKTLGRFLVYCARTERAVTDCKLFLANKDMMLIQRIFNLVESKMAKNFRVVNGKNLQLLERFTRVHHF